PARWSSRAISRGSRSAWRPVRGSAVRPVRSHRSWRSRWRQQLRAEVAGRAIPLPRAIPDDEKSTDTLRSVSFGEEAGRASPAGFPPTSPQRIVSLVQEGRPSMGQDTPLISRRTPSSRDERVQPGGRRGRRELIFAAWFAVAVAALALAPHALAARDDLDL